MTAELSLFDTSSENQPLTMGTREIAELLGKQHNHVKVSAERLAEKGVIGTPATREFIHNGNTYAEYLLPKRDCLILVAQNCPEFTAKIIDRWQELESASATGALALPKTYLDALKALVTSVEAQQRAEYQAAELASENAKLLPRAKVADTIADATGLHSVAAAAKILGTGQNKLFERLRKSKILNGHNVPYQTFIDRGYFVVRETTFSVNGAAHIHPQTFVTGKGMAWMTKNMVRDGQGTMVQ